MTIESVFKNNLLANKGYLFKFDLKNGYHIYIVDYHQNVSQFFLEYQWATKCFVFTVLPFSLSSSLFVFRKVVRPLVKYWRFQAVKIASYLDDSLGIAYIYQDALSWSNIV